MASDHQGRRNKRVKTDDGSLSVSVANLGQRRLLDAAANEILNLVNDKIYRFGDEENNYHQQQQQILTQGETITKLKLQSRQAKEQRKNKDLTQQLAVERQCLKEEIKMLQFSNEKLTEETRGLEKTLRARQEAAFDSLSPAKWQPEPDSHVENQFSSLDQMIQRWSKRNAILSWSENEGLCRVEAQALRDQLQPVFYQNTPGQLPGGLLEAHVIDKTPAMLLQAVVSLDIYSNLINGPFFFLRTLIDNSGTANSGSELILEGTTDILNSLTNVMNQENPQQSNAWRAELLRMFDSAKVNSNATVSGTRSDQKKSAAAQAIDDEVLRLQKRFIESHKLLVRGNATQNQTQGLRSHTVLNIDNLKQTYNNSSLVYRACDLHNRQLDEDPDSLDNKQPILCLSPCVMARGKSDGTELDVPRVWKKALVYIGVPPAPPKRHATVPASPLKAMGSPRSVLANKKETTAPNTNGNEEGAEDETAEARGKKRAHTEEYAQTEL